jgi:hypothetical protein
MTLDDDSILSAYLDGELPPEQQQAVESALAADPQLADEVRSLAALRDLVAGLPCPVPADVTARVMRRVRRRALLGPAASIIAWAPVRAGWLAAVAAGVLLAVALTWIVRVGPGPAGVGGPDAVVRSHPVEPVRPAVADDRWPPFKAARALNRRSEPSGAGDGRTSAAEPAPGDGLAPSELSHVGEYLDNPQLRRIFMVSDPGDGSAERQVASIVEQTTQFNYLRITVSQGIVIDPRHPDRATVFALVVGPREMHRLGEQLHMALRDRVEEADAEPAIVTQLADIGQVEALRPSPAADMQIPREQVLSIKHRDAGVGGDAPEGPRAEPPKASDRPLPEQERSMPNPELSAPPQVSGPSAEPVRRPPTRRPPAAQDADQSFVVLVWVARPRPG